LEVQKTTTGQYSKSPDWFD